MTLNCLVTGFDAFAGESFNPSEVIVRGLPKELKFSDGRVAAIQSLILPTCGDEAWSKLEPVLKEMEPPAIVVSLGLASKRSTICLERFALNIRDDKTPDNQGHIFAGETIDPNEPAALHTNAPIEDLLKHLHGEGCPVVISNHAGTFVCNEIYFRTLQYFSKSSGKVLVSFVHLPLPENYGEALTENKSKAVAKNREEQMAAMQAAVQAILEYYLISFS